MKIKITKNDLESTIAELPEGIVLATGEPLTRERVRKAIVAAVAGDILNYNYVQGYDAKQQRWVKKRNTKGRQHTIMLSSDHKTIGIVMNSDAGPCHMEGCTGHRQYVRWEDGTYTYPCSKGCSGVADGVEMIG